MLTRLIDRFDADGTRHRGSWFPSSASPIVLVLVVVLVLGLLVSLTYQRRGRIFTTCRIAQERVPEVQREAKASERR
jgi:hypothetical protein